MKTCIVDDEEVSLFITRRMLVLQGVSEDKEICTFLSAKEALDALSNCKEEEIPGIVLLDLNVPLMDGWQFLSALEPLRSKFEGRCRIYILTSSLSKSDAEKARHNPMVAGFMHKPISTEDIRVLGTC